MSHFVKRRENLSKDKKYLSEAYRKAVGEQTANEIEEGLTRMAKCRVDEDEKISKMTTDEELRNYYADIVKDAIKDAKNCGMKITENN